MDGDGLGGDEQAAARCCVRGPSATRRSTSSSRSVRPERAAGGRRRRQAQPRLSTGGEDGVHQRLGTQALPDGQCLGQGPPGFGGVPGRSLPLPGPEEHPPQLVRAHHLPPGGDRAGPGLGAVPPDPAREVRPDGGLPGAVPVVARGREREEVLDARRHPGACVGRRVTVRREVGLPARDDAQQGVEVPGVRRDPVVLQHRVDHLAHLLGVRTGADVDVGVAGRQQVVDIGVLDRVAPGSRRPPGPVRQRPASPMGQVVAESGSRPEDVVGEVRLGERALEDRVRLVPAPEVQETLGEIHGGHPPVGGHRSGLVPAQELHHPLDRLHALDVATRGPQHHRQRLQGLLACEQVP